MNYLKNPWTPFFFDGCFLKLPVGKGMTFNITALRPDWMTFLLKKLSSFQSEDECFFDVGANLGQTLINYRTAEATKNYLGFEPDPYCIVYLKRLIELNKMTNTSIAPVGLSESERLLKLYSSSPTDSGASLRSNLRPARKLYSSIVPTFKLDNVVRQLESKPVSLLKIDVEGWELEVLKGMPDIFQSERPIIICEIIFRDVEAPLKEHQQRNREILDILAKYKYYIFQLIKTPDLKEIQGIKEIKEFSDEVWTVDNKHLCDYLFVPDNRKTQILDLFEKI